jgi:hypothetical protein
MTAAQECIWGISISLSEGQTGLQTTYSNFATEARLVKPDFTPKSVVMDGRAATRNAWLTLFPCINIMLLIWCAKSRLVYQKSQRIMGRNPKNALGC